MQDNFEDFVKQHKDEFDEYEVPAGVWQRVQDRVPARRVQLGRGWMAVAASVLLLVGFFVWKQPAQMPEPQQTQVAAGGCGADNELAAAEHYYTGMIEANETKLGDYKTRFPDLYHEFAMEMDTLNRDYASLKSEYVRNACNEMVQKALIQNLQTQVQLVQQQLQVIEGIMNYSKNANS